MTARAAHRRTPNQKHAATHARTQKHTKTLKGNSSVHKTQRQNEKHHNENTLCNPLVGAWLVVQGHLKWHVSPVGAHLVIKIVLLELLCIFISCGPFTPLVTALPQHFLILNFKLVDKAKCGWPRENMLSISIMGIVVACVH